MKNMSFLLIFCFMFISTISNSKSAEELLIEDAANLQREGKEIEAILKYDDILVQYPISREAYANRGVCKRRLGRYKEAIADFDKCMKLYPEHPECYTLRGYTNFSLGNNEEALKDYKKATGISPSARSFNDLAFIYKNLGQYEKALSNHKKALSYAKENSSEHDYSQSLISYHENIASILTLQKKYKEAIKEIEQAKQLELLTKEIPFTYFMNKDIAILEILDAFKDKKNKDLIHSSFDLNGITDEDLSNLVNYNNTRGLKEASKTLDMIIAYGAEEKTEE